MKIEDVKVGQKVRMAFVDKWMDECLPGIKVGTELTVREISSFFILVKENDCLRLLPKWVEPVGQPVEADYLICSKGLKWRDAAPEDAGKFGFVSDVGVSVYKKSTSIPKIEGKLEFSEGRWGVPARGYINFKNAFVPVDKIVENEGKYYKIATKDDVGKLAYFYDFEDEVGAAIESQSRPREIELIRDQFAMKGSKIPFTFAFIPLDNLKQESKIEESQVDSSVEPTDTKEEKMPSLLDEVAITDIIYWENEKEFNWSKEKMESVVVPEKQFEAGQKVLITKPSELSKEGRLTWIESMNPIDGRIFQLREPIDGKTVHLGGWWLDTSWLTPLVESGGRYLRKATKDDMESDGTEWEFAYVEVFDKSPIDKEEKSVKVEESKEPKQEETKVSKFKVGQKVRMTKPERDQSPFWVSDMNKFDGKVGTVTSVNPGSGNCHINGYNFHKDWLTLVEDLTDSQEDVEVTTAMHIPPNQYGLTAWKLPGRGNKVMAGVKTLNPCSESRALNHWGESSYTKVDTTYKITPDMLKDPINPAEKSAKPPKKESKMALVSLLSSKVRGLLWSVIDWSIVAPTKNTLRPVVKITQYALCYSILATVVYSGWSLYQNPSWVFEKVSEMSPITIQFKGDPANEPAETVESIVEARVQAAKVAADEPSESEVAQ
jgi:hypothetical protein